MQKLSLRYGLLGLVLAGIGYYYWQQFASIQCEPCLPPPAPCPACPSVYAPYILGLTVGLELILLLIWRYHQRRVSVKSRA